MVSSNLKKISIFADTLDHGIDLKVQVTGRSMTPALRSGEVVVIRKTPHIHLRVGDLIFFKSRKALVLHRILFKQYTTKNTILFRTKGDAAKSLDEPVLPDQVLGRVSEIHRQSLAGAWIRHNMARFTWQIRNKLIAVQHLFMLAVYCAFIRIKRVSLLNINK